MSIFTAESNAAVQEIKELVANKHTSTVLFDLEDVARDRTWNYELPTLVKSGRFLSREAWADNDFFLAFYEQFPLLSDVDFTDLAVVGGAVFDILHKRTNLLKDIDIFMVGEQFADDDAVLARAARFLDDIQSVLVAKDAEYKLVAKDAEYKQRIKRGYVSSHERATASPFGLDGFKATRNGPVITISIPSITQNLQLVLSPNKDLPSLFHRVDLPCTEMAFYDEQIKMSALGKFCFENGACVVIPQKASSFSTRLLKYFGKGVDMILPNLHLDNLSRKNFQFEMSEVVVLADLAIIYTKIAGNKIFVNNLQQVKDSGSVWPSARASNCYDGSDVVDIHNSANNIHSNLQKLNGGREEKSFMISADQKNTKDVLLAIPKITERMITNSYETVLGHLEEMVENRKYCLKKFEMYFVVRPVSEIMSELVVKPLLAREAWNAENADANKKDVYDEKAESDALLKYLVQLVHAQIEDTKVKLAKLQASVVQDPIRYRVVCDEWRDESERYAPAAARQWYGDTTFHEI